MPSIESPSILCRARCCVLNCPVLLSVFTSLLECFNYVILQLKQGRPVQREAVLAGGAGDYTSMMYGDKEAPLGSVSSPSATPEVDAAPAAADSVEKDVVKKAEAVESTPVSAPAAPAGSSGTQPAVTICTKDSITRLA